MLGDLPRSGADVSMRFVVQLLVGAAGLALPALAMMSPAAAQGSNLVATPGKAAVIPVMPPARVPERLFFDLWVRAYTPPKRGAVEAVVTLGKGERGIEIGRFAVFPSEPFVATDASQQRAYRFNATSAVAAFRGDRELTAQVRLVPVDERVPVEGAQLTIERAELNPPPPQ
jgi:hypothetical protein